MRIQRESIREDFHRDLYWSRLIFSSDDEKKRTQVLTCATEEYLMSISKAPHENGISKQELEAWLTGVEAKWAKLGKDILNQDVHYDVYSSTPGGETNGLNYLMGKMK